MRIDVWLGGSERSHVHPEVSFRTQQAHPPYTGEGVARDVSVPVSSQEIAGNRKEGERESRMVDEAIRTLTASRTGTQARCQHRSEAEFPNTRFTTLDCSVAPLGR
jgi:hypothetical protein